MKSNEWYTPAKYIEAARAVMGKIDLDPASCYEANLTVRATRYYDKTENGLMQPWAGCVWLNLPFREENGISKRDFIKKLTHSYEIGQVEQAVLLIFASMTFRWFHPLWDYPICFTDHQVSFMRPDDRPGHIREETAFVYLGPHEQRFIDVFSRFGTVARRVSAPKPVPYMEELFAS